MGVGVALSRESGTTSFCHPDGMKMRKAMAKITAMVKRMRERESAELKNAMGWRIETYRSMVIPTRQRALKRVGFLL